MSIVIRDLSYRYTNQSALFEHVSLSVAAGGKVSIVGNNGTGKSTLLRLMSGELAPVSGDVNCASYPYYVPQQAASGGQSAAGVLGVSAKLAALQAIYAGSCEQRHYETLADDWDIESHCRAALDDWGLPYVGPDTPVDSLSGGERTRLLLSGLMVHNPGIVLLDEPTNHLDRRGRRKLYDYIRGSNATMVVVSHDIELLNLLDATCELSAEGLRHYGGNYDFYREQKQLEDGALEQRIDAEQTALRLARKKAQEVRERQQKRFNQGERNKDQLPRILRKGAKDRGESTIARLGGKHSEIIAQSREKLGELRGQQPPGVELRIDFDDAQLHDGKLLAAASGLNFAYDAGRPLWRKPLDLELFSGDRIHLAGDNGTGKTTLVRLLTGELSPTEGIVRRAGFSYVWLDQQYSRADTPETVLELAQRHNRHNLPDHELKMRLHRALFPKDAWDKSCRTLSGGERMRLCLCCLMIFDHVPDLFILDEPTNNLDLSSLAILTDTIRNYRGTLLVVSHDRRFVEEVGVTATIELE